MEQTQEEETVTEDSQFIQLPKVLLSESCSGPCSPSANLCIFKCLIFVWFPLTIQLHPSKQKPAKFLKASLYTQH